MRVHVNGKSRLANQKSERSRGRDKNFAVAFAANVRRVNEV